jgi:ATP phosphoribosyltransferase
MSKLKIAIQKNGRLSEKSLSLLIECGIRLSNSDRKLKSEASNFPLEVLFLRDDDIPQYVEEGVADIGIIGENVVWEKARNVSEIRKLGFAQCRLSLAIPKDEVYDGLHYFKNKKIATSYPGILKQYLDSQQINAQIEEIGGSVEIAPGIGLSHAIFDIVGTGSTLLMNGLKEVNVVKQSEAVLIGNAHIGNDKAALLEQLLFRIKAVKDAASNKYILLNVSNHKLKQIISLLPGMKSPTILPLAIPGWSSVHTVIKEETFWEVIIKLKEIGAEGILVLDIEKMIV